MESSHVLGGSSSKKYSDAESGWTMYIGSQIYNEEDDDHDIDGRDNEKRPNRREDYEGDGDGDDDDDDDGGGGGGGESDDDSMASDASSGPIGVNELMKIPGGAKEGSEVLGGLKNSAGHVEQRKCFSANKKHGKHVKKIRDERRVRRSEKKLDHEQTVVTTADSAESQV